MKLLSTVVILALVYVGIVAAFEAWLGYFQPRAGLTLVITTFEDDGTAYDRVVSRLDSEGPLYVAANHWPRAWYHRALENPEVRITLQEETGGYRAVPVTGSEHDRVDEDNRLGIAFRIPTGFPPRYFLRLERR